MERKISQHYWEEENVKRILTNPVYIGLGHYPPIMEEKEFIKIGIKYIAEHGAEDYLKRLLNNLKWHLPYKSYNERKAEGE